MAPVIGLCCSTTALRFTKNVQSKVIVLNFINIFKIERKNIVKINNYLDNLDEKIPNFQ
jgi:hypothetical protein